MVAGATIVFMVVIAVDILHTGAAGVGNLDSALGVGAIVGGVDAIARSTGTGSAGTSRSVWCCGPHRSCCWRRSPPPATLVAVALLGFGNPLVDVNFATIVQRSRRTL